jgi:hypothetical protein
MRLDKKRSERGNLVIEKVGYDREFMTGPIKVENLQGKTHCDIVKMIDKEQI